MTRLEALVAQYLGIQELMITFLEKRLEMPIPLADALVKKQTAIRGELGATVFIGLMIGDEQYGLVRH